MINQLNTIPPNNGLVTRQTLYTQQAFQTMMNSADNSPILKDMEYEIILWVIRIIISFMFVLMLYINLTYTVPLECFGLILIFWDILFFSYYTKKYKILR